MQLEIPNLEPVSCNALETSLVFHFPWSSAAGPSNAFVLRQFYGFLVYHGGLGGRYSSRITPIFLTHNTSRKSRIFTTWRSTSTWSRIFTIWRNQRSRNEKKGHNTIGQSNNAFSILGFFWHENEESMFWSFHPLGDKTDKWRTLTETIFQCHAKIALNSWHSSFNWNLLKKRFGWKHTRRFTLF